MYVQGFAENVVTGERFHTIRDGDKEKTLCTRGPEDGSKPNAWGQFYPDEPTQEQILGALPTQT